MRIKFRPSFEQKEDVNFSKSTLASSFRKIMTIQACHSLVMVARIIKHFSAGIAQLVEQRTENPRVASSILAPGI